jgi:hypothetical protein
MIRIEENDYYHHGRDGITPEITSNAVVLLSRANKLLDCMVLDQVPLDTNARGTYVNSGFRPAAVNAGIPNAAPRSNHMKGLAIDLNDPEGALDDWCMANLKVLEEIGLWLEHPGSTKGWCHIQAISPRSGNRVFYP